ncbi:MAG TPA: UDP-N-acetylmuramoyl-tripeptide--D-alanyl-D-alanine ligase [Thermoanaerobaculia bacterium]|nr:UDP-N-acetylmuramoyl-tripeptide--D-alanyl-D-alanine ligase [Thermoanaerobaculia bacterium]
MDGRVISGAALGSWRGVAIDSRRVAGGEIFFALAGERTDGHRFVDAALERGAAAAVVERPVERSAAFAERALIQVDSSMGALHAVTRWARRSTPRRLIAITGSAGKTTTKEILASLLAARFRVAASPGNYNNLLGFPLALMAIPADTEWMVAEMAMSIPGELAEVSRLGSPDVAVFTNVRAVHLEGFEREGRPADVHRIAQAKAELLEGLTTGGLVIANAADPEVVWIAERHRAAGGRVAWFALDRRTGGIAPRLEVEGLSMGALSGGRYGSTFELADRESGASVRIELGLHGRVNVENFLAAATCALELGVELDGLSARALGPQPGRGFVHALTAPVSALVIDDSYNSNPDALRQAVEARAGLPGKRHWAVIGEMRELGSAAPALHRTAGEQAAASGLERILGVGTLSRELLAAAQAKGVATEWFADAEQAAARARELLEEGDVVLVKGSRGVGLEIVVEALLGDRCGRGSGSGRGGDAGAKAAARDDEGEL